MIKSQPPTYVPAVRAERSFSSSPRNELTETQKEFYLRRLMLAFQKQFATHDLHVGKIKMFHKASETDQQENSATEFEARLPNIPIPVELPILPARGIVVFPSAVASLQISREFTRRLVADCLTGNRILGIALQKDLEDYNPEPGALFSCGCAGQIIKAFQYPDGSFQISVRGLKRIEIKKYVRYKPYFCAQVVQLEDTLQPDEALNVLRDYQTDQFLQFASLVSHLYYAGMEMAHLPRGLVEAIKIIQDPAQLSDLIAAYLNIASYEKQELLQTLNVGSRLEKLSVLLSREVSLINLANKIWLQTRRTLLTEHKTFYLQLWIRTIQQELREEETSDEEVLIAKPLVAIIGEFQRGKSTLVNCLLNGKVALAGHGLATTRIPVRYRLGDVTVVQGKDKAGRTFELELNDFLSLSSVGSWQMSESVIVSLYSPLLQHMDIIDTPGFDVDDQDTEAAIRTGQTADFLILLMARDLPTQNKSFLKFLRTTIGKKPYGLVVNCGLDNSAHWPEAWASEELEKSIRMKLTQEGLPPPVFQHRTNLLWTYSMGDLRERKGWTPRETFSKSGFKGLREKLTAAVLAVKLKRNSQRS